MTAQRVKGYCSQCSCYCPTVAIVEDGKFVRVEADNEHQNACAICPKGLAGPELVYSEERLRYPLRRTRPKGDPDPGWERITWDEALEAIAVKLKEIKAKFGPEGVVFARCGPAGSPMGEIDYWARRLASAFGSPNNIATTHICQWHRDNGSAYTYGRPGTPMTWGRPEFERAKCILIWGCNIHATRQSLLPFIKRGMKQGAKLIVIDPRKIQIAAMADLWLQVCPGTDGALALSMISVMIEEGLYDDAFVRSWTNAPFLVRTDTGNLLKAPELIEGEDASCYVMVNAISQSTMTHKPGATAPAEPVLDAVLDVTLTGGQKVTCKTAFRLLRELASGYLPARAESITRVPADNIRGAARMLATLKPACWYSFNGIEQSTNASQTNRAVCILYAMTGCYDVPGGNVILPKMPANPIGGTEFLSAGIEEKRLGSKERPLGPAGVSQSIQAYEVYKAILTGQPYPVKAIVGFGGNIIMSNAPSQLARNALSKLDFHVQAELFMTPTAELADIVLPVASFWESWHVRTNVESSGTKSFVQLRPVVVPPQHESWPDMKIIFELGKKLGFSERFWNGDIEAGFNYQLAPAGITVEQLRMKPEGIYFDLPSAYKKYTRADSTGKPAGFSTPSNRVEIYSQTLKDHGYSPLPLWEEPVASRFARTGLAEKFPLLLIGVKPSVYCHSQHRALPSLRKAIPQPFLEVNPRNAVEVGCKDGDWVILETPHGNITLKAKVTDGIAHNVVCTQNGWWQECKELNLPGYDPYSSEGANINLLYVTEEIDRLSGSLPLKGYPCAVRIKGGSRPFLC